MDPNECLTQLRRLVAGLAEKSNRQGGDNTYDEDRFIDLFTSLDEWMTRGGFIPREWARERESLAAKKREVKRESSAALRAVAWREAVAKARRGDPSRFGQLVDQARFSRGLDYNATARECLAAVTDLDSVEFDQFCDAADRLDSETGS